MNSTVRQELDLVLDQLEPDAIRAMAYLGARLLVGQQCYGRLDLATDKRDWRKEIVAEVGDLLVYSAFEALKRALPGPSSVTIVEAAATSPESPQAKRDTFSKEADTNPAAPRVKRPGLKFACACMLAGFVCSNCDRPLVEA